MKIQYIAHDIASVLTEYYIRLRMINPSEQKRYVMQLHIKQAILSTYHSMYGEEIDDVWSIDIFESIYNHHTYLLKHDTIYERDIVMNMITDMKQRLFNTLSSDDKYHTITDNDDVINIHVVPFDGLPITRFDITSLLDLDAL